MKLTCKKLGKNSDGNQPGEKMNIYGKLNKARKKFHSQPIKKTGRNNFAKYDYFELADFIVPALNIFDEVGLCGLVSFTPEKATLTVCEAEGEGVIVFESPMSSAALKGCHEVQNLGAVQTYLRRYLWVMALEIVEHDAVDSQKPIESSNKAKGAISPTMGAMESLPKEEREYIEELAEKVKEAADLIDFNESYQVIAKENLDADQKTALWSLLDSKLRSGIKKAGEVKKSNQGG